MMMLLVFEVFMAAGKLWWKHAGDHSFKVKIASKFQVISVTVIFKLKFFS